MVVPGSAPLIQQDHALEPALGRDSSHGSAMGPDTEPAPGQVGPELEEVRKLRELVRRLELENQHPRTKGGRSVLGPKAAGESRDPALSGTDIHNGINALADARGLQIVADLHHQLSQMRKEGGDNGCPLKGGDAQVQHGCSGAAEEPPPGAPRNGPGLLGSWVLGDVDPTGKRQHPDAAGSSGEVAVLPDNADLDEVKVLELDCCLEDDDSWLYVSPRKSVDQKPASPLSWCRQVLDNPSPETEAACRTLITRLDQASRWKNLYCSPLASPSAHNLSTEPGSSSNALNSPGHLKSTNKALLTCGSSGFLAVHSALSSQSSVDSELSTSDDSISMGYKLQDLTDVQVMARLQEESLRQDCASSSASVSRRSSSASLHSLRRGTYSDQEFDNYSLEDEEDGDCSLSYRSAHRYSPSPLSSPRCQSPSSCTDHGRGSASRIRPPRRSVQSPLQDRLKYASSEEEMRHSMPNLARTGLRSLESVRSSRSLESDLQGPSSRIPRTQQRSAGLAPSKLRYSSGAGQSPLTVRQPLKGGSCPTPLLPPRQAVKAGGSYAAPGGGARKAQGSSLGTGSSSGSCSARGTNVGTVAKNSPLKPRTAVGGLSVPRNKPTTPSRRFLQSAQPPEDDSWKEGCY